MQFDFGFDYKKGKENIVGYALSRIPVVELATFILSTMRPNFFMDRGYSID